MTFNKFKIAAPNQRECTISKSVVLFLSLFLFLLFGVENGIAQNRIIVNPSFETGSIIPHNDVAYPESQVGDTPQIDGWYSTHPIYNGAEGAIEHWRSGFNGISASNGDYFVELNVTQPSRLYQIVYLNNGETIEYEYFHRRRGSSPETVEFSIYDATGSAKVQVLSTNTTSGTDWNRAAGSAVFTGSSGVYQIGFEATVPATGGSGNFLDNISIALDGLTEFSKSAITITEGSPLDLSLIVNGEVNSSSSITVTTGGSATEGVDYTIPTRTINVPTGNYAVADSISTGIVFPDNTISDGPRTLTLNISSVAGDIQTGDANGDGNNQTITVTILDDEVSPGGVQGTRLWLDASDIDGDGNESNNPTDGSTVSNWIDKSGRGNNATPAGISQGGAGLPKFFANQFNGRPALRFEKTGTTSGAGLGAILSSPYLGPLTVFMVLESQTDAPDNFDAFFSSWNSPGTSGSFQIDYDGSSSFQVRTTEGNTRFEPVNRELSLYGIRYDGTTLKTLIDGSDANSRAINNLGFNSYRIGVNRNADRFFDSKIAEVIIYHRHLDDCEVEKINLYLGKKYGRDFNNIAANFGFEVNFPDDITGIGAFASACTGLNTIDIATSSILFIDNPSSNNTANEFLTLGHDAGALTTSGMNVPVSLSGQTRLQRSWKIDRDGDVGTVDMEFDVNGISGIGSQLADFKLIIDTDGDGNFLTGTTQVVDANTFAGNKVGFNAVTLPNNAVISLTTGATPGPGVFGANLWLKGDVGLSPSTGTTTGWIDQTGINAFTVEGAGSSIVPLGFNFNPSVRFNGINDYLQGNSPIKFQTVYAVYKREEDSNSGTVVAVNPGVEGFTGHMLTGSIMLANNDESGTVSNFFSTGNLGIEKARIAITQIVPGADLSSQFTAIDGKVFPTRGLQGSVFQPFTGTPIIGSTLATKGASYFKGELAELIMYPVEHNAMQRVQIQSYLAIKYGITLDPSGGNYIASDATTVLWNTTTYWNDVFGIGKDDGSGLNQPKSNSINTGNGAGTGLAGKGNIVLSNPSSLDNLDFLMIGHDNGALTEQTSGLPSGVTGKSRLTRQWKVKKTNDLGTVDLSFDLNGICLSGVVNTNYELWIDEDGNGDFTNGTVTKITASALASNKLTFSGVTFNDNVVFTIAGTPASMALTSATNTDNQESCLTTAIQPIEYTGANLSGATVTGLPAGLTSTFNQVAQTFTIEGTATETGVFNYTITTTSQQCSTAPQITGTITIDAENTASSPSSSPTVVFNTPIPSVTITTTGATGIGTPSGLPIGVSASWAADTISITGTPTTQGTYNYSIPLTGGCGTVNATGTITVRDNDFDGDGIPDNLDLDADNDGILNTDEGFASVTPANPISTYTSSTRTVAANGPNVGTPTNGYQITDRSTSGKFAFEAISSSEQGSGSGIGTISYVTIDVDFAPLEYVNNVDVSFKIGSTSSPTGSGYFDEGFYIEINGVVVVNFNDTAYNNNSAFNQKFDINGGGWAPWNGEGNPELVLDLLGRSVKLMADTKTGTREDVLALFPASAKPNPMPIVDFEQGVTIGTAFNNRSGPGGIGYQTLSFSADVKTHRDSNNDGIFDFLSVDADNDGCNDVDEAYGLGFDTNGNGQYGATPTVANGGVNSNGLVIAAGIAANGTHYLKTPLDGDNNGTLDFSQVSKQITAITTEPTDATSTIDNPVTFTLDYSTTATGVEPLVQWYTKAGGTGTEVMLTDGTVNGITYSGVTTKSLTVSGFKSTNSSDVFYAKISTPSVVCNPDFTTQEAVLTVTPHVLEANADTYTLNKPVSSVDAPTGVQENDLLLSAVPVITGASKNSTITASFDPQLNIDFDVNTGILTVNSNTPVGTHSLTYTICEDIDPTNCKTGSITVIVLEDTDLDGVADVNDLDDDNDGILDTDEGTCVLPAQMRLGYIPNSRDLDGDNGYTLDGSYMQNALTSKITNPANFGPNGIVKTEIILVPITANPITEIELNTLNLDALFIGGIDKAPTVESWLSDAEFTAIQNWSKGPNKSVLVTQAGATKWGRTLSATNTNPNTPNTIGANTYIFNGPFGTVSSFTQGGTFQAIFNADVSRPDVVLATDGNGERVMLKDGVYQDILLSDVDVLTTTGGVSSGNGISNDNDRLALNLIYTMIPLSACPGTDIDLDGVSNSLDLDSDGDGCNDVVEAYGNSVDPDGDGVFGTGSPTVDANGLVLAAGVSGTSYTNTPNDINNDGILDYTQTSNIALSVKTQPDFGGSVQSNSNAFLTFELNTSSTGLPPTYQWQIRPSGSSNWQDLTASATYNGVTNDTLFISNVKSSLNKNLYRVRIENPTIVCGSTFNSQETLLTVIPDPVQITDDSVSIAESFSGIAISSVLDNDLVNNVQGSQSNSTLTLVGSLPSGMTFNTTTGEVSVDGTIAVGTYTFDYQLCETVDPTNCATGTVTITILKDTDSDGVADVNDLDDDNDGITDDNEGSKVTQVGTKFLSGSGTGNVTGTLSSAAGNIVYDIVYTGSANSSNGGIGNSSDFFNNGTEVSAAVNQAGVLTSFSLTPQGSAQLSDLQAIQVDFSYVQDNHTYTFNQALSNFTLKSGTSGSISADGKVVTITSGNNSAGAGFTAVLANPFTNPFTVNAKYSTNNTDTYTIKFSASIFDQLDTDNDGIADSLDPDSDNDGCSDTKEVYGSATDFGTNPTVDANGLVVAAGVTGSTYTTAPTDNDTNGILDFQQVSKSLVSISSHPIDHVTNVNRPVTFNVVVNTSGTGTDIDYQWQVNPGGTGTWTDIIDNTNYSGATTASLTVTPSNAAFSGNLYRVQLTTPSFTCDADLTSLTPVLVINSNAINANNDVATVVERIASTNVLNVLSNDELDHSAVNISDITVTQISSSNPGLSLDTATGIIQINNTVTEGIYFVEYRICENLDPTNCSTANVTIVVQKDTDGDGIPDSTDPDIDGDGNPNTTDPNPNIPTANDESATLQINQVNEIDILANDDFLPGSNTTITRTGGSAGGTVAFDNLTGKLSYTPLTSEAGKTLDLVYQVTNSLTGISSSATVSLTVDDEADLSLGLSVDNSTPNVGSTVVFTLVVNNAGPSNATNVDVLSALPSGYTYQSATATSGTYNQVTGEWFLASIAQGTSQTLTLTATVKPSGDYTQVGTIVFSDQTDPDSTPANGNVAEDDYASVSVTPSDITDIQTILTVNQSTANQGESVVYQIKVVNNGPSNATNVTSTFTLPSGTTYTSDDSSGSYNPTSGLWTIGSLNQNQSEVLHITATIDNGQAGNTITGTISQVGAGSETDSTTTGDVTSVDVVVNNAVLTTTIAADNSTPNEGDMVKFTINVTNAGPSESTNIQLTSVLPTGLTFVSASGNGTYNATTGLWTLSSIPASGSESLEIITTVNSGTAGTTISTPVSTLISDQSSSNTLPSAASITVKSIDLVTVLSVDDATPNEGSTIKYTIQVTNNGSDNATNIRVTDLLPTGVTYVSDNGSGAYNSTTGIWTVGTINNGNAASLEITATVDTGTAGTHIDNTITSVSATETDTTSTGDSLTASISVSNINLVTVLSIGNPIPNVNAPNTIEINVSNASSGTASGVNLTSLIPSGLTYVSHSASVGSYDQTTGAWTIGTVQGGSSTSLVINVTVDSNQGNQTITASTTAATGNQTDPTTTGDVLSASMVPTSANLISTIAVNNPTPNEGDTVSITISVKNAGPSDETNTSLTHTLPAGLTYVTDNGGGAYDSGTGVWTIGSISAGATRKLNITATIDSGTGGSSLTTSITAASGDQADTDTSGNQLTASINVTSANLVTHIKVDNTTPNVGSNVVFTIDITNNGPNDETATSLTSLVPSGLTYVSHSATTGTYNQGSGLWTIGSIAKNTTQTLTITATINAGQGGNTITQTTTAASGSQSDPTTNGDVLSASITPTSTNLVTVISVDNTVPNEGSTVRYTINVSNVSSTDATNVSLTSLLPSGITYSSNSVSQGSYNDATGVWTIGTLTAGSLATIEITGTVAAGSLGSTITTSTTAASGDQTDTSFSGDVLSASITVTNSNLITVASVNNTSPNINDTIIFSIDVTNNGPSDQTGVSLTDVLPSGVTYVSHSASAGTYVSGTGVWTIGTVTPNTTQTLEVSATVNADQGGNTLTYTTSAASGNEADPSTVGDVLSASTTVTSANLVTVMSVNNSNPNAGDTVKFTIDVSNNGPGQETNVTLIDLLPSGLTYSSSTASAGSYNSSSGLWTIGTIASGSSAKLELSATVDSGNNGQTITNTISQRATGDQTDPTTAGDVLSQDITVTSANLITVISVDNSAPNEGDTVIYSVVVTNNGPSLENGVSLTSLLPTGISYVSHLTSEGSYSATTGLWNIGTINASNSETLTLIGTVDSGTGGTTITTTTTAAQGSIADTNTAGDNLSVALTVTKADLISILSVDNTAPNEGDTVTFSIKVTNNGPNNETNTSLTSLLPTGLTYSSHTASQGVFNQATGNWNIGNIAVNTTETLTVKATVDANTGGTSITKTITAAVGNQSDANTTGDVLSTTLNIENTADVVLGKLVDNSTPNEGDVINYTIRVTNNGPANVTNLIISDVLPSGLTLLNEFSSVGVWDTNTSTWTLSTLPNGETRNLTLEVRVNSGTGGTQIVNTISNTQDQTDSNVTADDNSETIRVTQIDLSTVVSVNNSSPNEGDTVTYSITVSNASGSDSATNVSLTDVLPNGVTYVSDNGNGAYNSGSGLWTIGTIPAGSSKTLLIDATVNAGTGGTTITNTSGAATADQSDSNATADQLSASITVSSVDLITLMSVDNSTPNEGDTIVYSISVENNSASDASNAVLTHRLPAGVTYVSDNSGGNYNPTSGLWSIGTIAAGTTSTLSITTTVDNGTGGSTITSSTTAATGDQSDPTQTGDDLVASITVQSSNLVTTNTVDVTEANVGDVVTYTLSITNNGPNAATNVSLTNSIPASLTYLNDTSGGSYNTATGLWTVGNVANGETISIDILATVTSAAAGKLVTSTLTNPASGDQADPTTANDILSNSFSVITNDLQVQLSSDKTNVNEGDTVVYTLVVTNKGPSQATSVSIVDNLPTGISYLSHTTSSGTYNTGSGEWSIGSLAKNSKATLTLSGVVQSGTGGQTLTNTTGNASADFSDSDTSNNSASASITIGNTSDIVLTNVVNNSSPNVGDTVTFTVTATNNGPTKVTTLVVQNNLPTGLTYSSVTPGAGSWSAPNWNIGSLDSGATVTLTIEATVDSSTGGQSLVNVISNSQDQTDSNLTQDDFNESIFVQSSNLVTIISVDNSTPNEGENITYSISVTNNGPSDATNISLTSLLPNGLSYVSDNGTGSYNSGSGLWTVANVTSGNTQTLNIVASVDNGTGGNHIIHSTTAATGDQFDPTTASDVLSVPIDVSSSELVTSISVDNSNPNESDTINFTITVNNQGGSDASNVSLSTSLPTGLTYQSHTAPTGTTYDVSNGLWSINSVAVSESKQLVISAKVDIATGGQSITTATTAAAGDQSDPNLVQDSLNATIVVSNQSDIVITKTVDNATPNAGDTIRYTVSVTNNSGAVVSNFRLTEALPNGLIEGNVTTSTGVWSAPFWNISSLDVGDTETLIVEAIVGSGLGGLSLTNTVSHAQDQKDSNTSSDDLSETITVTSSDLVTTITVDNSTPNEGDTINYTIVVTNNGSSDATGVSLTNLVPSGLSLVQASTADGTYNSVSGLWDIGNLTNGDVVTLILTATVDAGQGGKTITNSLNAPTANQTDPTTVGNILSASLTVSSTDLVTEISTDKSEANEGDSIVITVAVTNRGSNDGSNVSLSSVLPSGLTYVSDDSNGGYNPVTGIWNIGSLANSDTRELKITATVNSGTAGSSLTITTSKASADESDPTTLGDKLSTSIVIKNVDLTTSISVDNATPNIGDVINYTILVRNNGPYVAQNIRLTALLPGDLTYVSDNGSGNYDATSGVWNIGSLSSGFSTSLLISARVNDGTGGNTIVYTSTPAEGDEKDVNTTGDTLSASVTVTSANLITTKTVSTVSGTSSVFEGELVTYTITVFNDGASKATDVSLTDILPSGVTYVTHSPSQGVYNRDSGNWIVGELADQNTATLNITARVNSGESGNKIINTAVKAVGDQFDPTDAGNSLSAEIDVEEISDIYVSKTVDNPTPNIGDIITYTITALNNGPTRVTNFTITDNLPTGLTYISGVATNGVWNSPDWQIGTLDSGSSATLLLRVRVESGTGGQTLVNSLTKVHDQIDTDTTPDQLSASITVTSAELVTTKTANVTNANEGENIVYTITVQNNGPSDATNVSLIDLLPQGVTYVSDTSNGTYNPGSGFWSIGSIANGDSKVLTITATVNTGTGGQSITNTTTAASGDQYDPNAVQDDLEATITVSDQSDVYLTKIVNNSTPNEGDLITYTITATNNGGATVTNLVIEDVLPSGLTYESATASQGAWNFPNWSVGTLTAGQTVSATVSVRVNSGTRGLTLVNTLVNTQDQIDNNNTTDDDSESIRVTSVDLEVVKIVDNQSPNEGDVVTYTITVTNNGPDEATGILVLDNLPSGVTYVGHFANVGTYNENTGIWDIGLLANGGVAGLNINVRVDNGTTNVPITNRAEVIDVDQADAIAINDVSTATIVPGSTIDLELTKRIISTNAIYKVGDDISFELVITNNGPNTATGIEVTDVLPTGYQFVTYSSSKSYDATTGIWQVGSLDSQSSAVLVVNAKILAIGVYTNCAEVTKADQTDVDSTPGNGVDSEDDYSCVTINPSKNAELSIANTVVGGNLTPNSGDAISFRVFVSNSGPVKATGVEVTSLLPSGFTFVSYTTQVGTYNENLGLWTVGEIDAGMSFELIINAVVNPTGLYESCATITAQNQPEVDQTDNQSCVTINPIAIADLELSLNVDDNRPLAGATIVFTLKVSNKGPSNATDIEIEDILPSGYSFVSAVGSAGLYDDSTGIWSISDLASGAEETLAITVQVLSTGIWFNAIEIVSVNESDPDSTPNNGVTTEDDYAEVDVVPEIKVEKPQFFSPNGDGINDLFVIPNLHVEYPKFRLTIYNRYGYKVYQYQHNGNPNSEPVWWDGRSHFGVNVGGDILPAATYFYTVHFNDGTTKPQSGWVYLRR